MRRQQMTIYLLVVVGLLLAGPGCGEKQAAVNEKVTKANADRIKANETTLSETETLLGPGTDCSDPLLADFAGDVKAKKWGRGKDGEEIKVFYTPDGLIVAVSFTQWSSAR